MASQWWVIDVRGRFLGRCYATEAEIRRACGPYIEITGNGVNIFGLSSRGPKVGFMRHMTGLIWEGD